MIDIIRSTIGPVAKTVAALLTPLIVALVAYLAEQAGADVPYDPAAIEVVVTSLVSAVLVYAVANLPKG